MRPYQIVLLCLGAACVVLLSFADVTPSAGSRFLQKPEAKKEQQHEGHSIDEQLAAARARLTPALAQAVAAWEKRIASEEDPVKRSMAYDSLATLLGRNREMTLAAWYTQQRAEKSNGSGNDWKKAGERWYAAARFTKAEEDVHVHYDMAMQCFGKALEMEPKNIEAKIGLGVCYVEATDQPMQGITLLKEALEADSTNVDALLNLGLFAERSQQYDKALERYRTILRLHPDYISMWLKMAEVYEAMGDKANTVACLEKYLALETDPVMKNDIENYLSRLKNTN